MRSSGLTLRLLEGACAAVVAMGAVYAAVVLLAAQPEALLFTYRRGGLTSLITVFAGACVGWLGLRMIRSRQRAPVALVIGVVCAVGLLAVTWRTTRGTVEEQHVTPSSPPGRFQPSQPPGDAPGTVQPPAPPPGLGP